MKHITTAQDIVDQYPAYAEHLSEDDPLYHLWEKAWHAPKDLFGEEEGFPVLRTGLKAKMKYIIVRPEYAQAYNDIRSIYIDVAKDNIVAIPKTTDGPKNFALDDVHKELCIDDEYHPTESRGSVLIIAGQPGIGKTMFLSYILVRRLAIHKFVIYQVQPSTFHIFHDRGVVSIKTDSKITPEHLQHMLPYSTWCLVDSNPDMITPPPFVQNFHQFIVQAASPNALQRDWFRKVGTACDHYIMKPMSLREIELSWHCLKRHSSNFESIGDHYTRFGPSTWGALFFHKQWETKLNHAFAILGSSVLLVAEILQDFNRIADHHPEISSKILLLTPGEYRDQPHVEVITEHVRDLFMKWIRKKWGSQMGDFYAALNQGPSGARSLAGQILEIGAHTLLEAGQVYPLKKLSQSGQTKTWGPVRSPASPHLLVLPSSATTFCISPPEPKQPSYPSRDHTKILIPERYTHQPSPVKDYTYYQPVSQNQATFDSFLYCSKSNTILAFQVTISVKHTVLHSGLEWLKGLRGDGQVDQPAIVLVGISLNDSLKFECKDGAEKLVKEFYHLKLDRFPEVKIRQRLVEVEVGDEEEVGDEKEVSNEEVSDEGEVSDGPIKMDTAPGIEEPAAMEGVE